MIECSGPVITPIGVPLEEKKGFLELQFPKMEQLFLQMHLALGLKLKESGFQILINYPYLVVRYFDFSFIKSLFYFSYKLGSYIPLFARQSYATNFSFTPESVKEVIVNTFGVSLINFPTSGSFDIFDPISFIFLLYSLNLLRKKHIFQC